MKENGRMERMEWRWHTSIQITQTQNTSIKSIYLDFVHSFIFVLWHNDVTHTYKKKICVFSSGCFGSCSLSLRVCVSWFPSLTGYGDDGSDAVAVVMMPSPISYYLTRMETKRGTQWSGPHILRAFRVTWAWKTVFMWCFLRTNENSHETKNAKIYQEWRAFAA